MTDLAFFILVTLSPLIWFWLVHKMSAKNLGRALLVFTAVFWLCGVIFSGIKAFAANSYDQKIREAHQSWPHAPDWLWYKAQLYQESLLNPYAVSGAGARGIAQFMPGTWREVRAKLSYPPHASAFDVKFAIDAGAFYMVTLKRKWRSPRPFMDRYYLSLASYNAGFGNLLKSQKLCNNALLYDEIVACLPLVTGHYSRETLGYVRRIKRIRARE